MQTTEEDVTLKLADGELRLVHVGQIRAAPSNPNKMRADQVEALKASIQKFGFAQPVTLRPLPDGLGFEMVDGHHRWASAGELGIEQIPARVVQLSDAEARIAAVALNRVRGNLDLAEVGAVFVEAMGDGLAQADLTVAGFSTEEVDDLLRIAGEQADPTSAALSGGETSIPEEDEPEPLPKPFMLEIEFADQATYKAARRALRRAAGKGKDLATGLMNVLGIES